VVDDESLSGLYTHLSHSGKVINKELSSGQYSHSGKEINEESICGQYTESQTGAHSSVRSTSDILQCTLQDLATVYHLLQGADQHNLWSKDILQATMTKLSSVTWLLHSAIQQRNHHSQPEQSPHLQRQEEYRFYNVMPETQDSRFLQSPRGGGPNPASHISPLQF
jgi:hypothetical protein